MTQPTLFRAPALIVTEGTSNFEKKKVATQVHVEGEKEREQETTI
jgi:hypothetical protein